MVDNTTELLSLIVKTMSMNDTEITNVKIYDQAVEINNKVKVRLSNGRYIVQRSDVSTGTFCYLNNDMLMEVLNLLSENDWLPGDSIEIHGEYFALVAEESSYYAEKNQYQDFRLLDDNYSLSDRMALDDLKKYYVNVSLEKRLK